MVRCNSKENNLSFTLTDVIHPVDNQFSNAKVNLGKKLFFDKRLSLDNSISCGSCHKPSLAFTDGLDSSNGVLGRKSSRNSPSILNVGFLPKLMFDGEISTLEMQTIVPIQDHNEMGMDMRELIERLRKIPEYQREAKKIFKRDFDPYVLTRSIAAYERTLISNNSAFDKFYYLKNKSALSKNAKRGFEIFSKKLYCTQCHSLPFFTTFKAENNGYTDINSKDLGRFRINFDSSDIGKFKIPSLRNVSVTAPYMHDGKIKTLDEVITFYSQGGRNVYNQSEIIEKFTLSAKEKTQLIEFLKSLEDY